MSGLIRVGTILPARVNPPHKSRVGQYGHITHYGQYAGFMNFWSKNHGFQSDDRYKSVEMILYSHILSSLNGKSEIDIKISVSTLTFKMYCYIPYECLL